MKKIHCLPGLFCLCLLSGCAGVGQKTASLSAVYGAAAVVSLLLLVGCCLLQKKSPWFVLLFSSVLVVNLGYFGLSVSRSLSQALMANRISYLGSVLLPVSMLMIILNTIHQSYRKWMPWVLLSVSALVLFVAASPGYLPIYYQEVSFEIVDGVSTLKKVYGPWHPLYLVFLLSYFGAMLIVIGYAGIKKRTVSSAQAVFVLIAVFVNLGVWFIEQLVKMDFEFLSVSYIISELFLLGIHLVMAENDKRTAEAVPPPPAVEETPPAAAEAEELALFTKGLQELTPTERTIYELYRSGLGTKEVLEKMNIKENTLKYHNRNIYSKLGVSSRKQLLAVAQQLP
jgi:DNA-binding CsgD family transcriptional regulator